MRKASEFTVYLRNDIWYVQWLDADGMRHWRSTGERMRPELKSLGREAAMIAAAKLVGRGPRSAPPTLRQFANDFYRWGVSPWIARQHAKGRGFNRHWAGALQAMMERYVFARFGEMRLNSLTRPMIESWLVGLQLSNQTKNHALYALRTILREAESEGIIQRNPLEYVEPMAKNGRRRDVFSLAELRQLFPESTEDLFSIWKSAKYAALFMTMATTGIREGEARALQWRHVLAEGWLLVERAIKVDGTVGPLKKRERTGEARVVALPSRTQKVLFSWRAQTPWSGDEDLIFFGQAANRPLNRRTFSDLFDRATHMAGVVRGERYLTSHSLRHTYNTVVRRAVPADILLALMGHRDSRMSDHYDHPGVEDRIRSLEPIRRHIEEAVAI
jgi:integrase